MQRKHILFTFIMIVSILLSACATSASPTVVESEAPAAAPTEVPPTSAPAAKKVVTFIWTQEFDTLSPLYTNMWFVSVIYPTYLCTPWMFDDNNDAFPYLVTEIPSVENGGLSEDGRTFTLKLRDDVVWSDGEPITSADFKFTYDMLMSDANAVASRSPYDQIESFETPDPQTMVITFTDPFAPWLALLFSGSTTGMPIIPEHILKPVFDSDGTLDTAAWNKAPTVGCGPFVFDEWQSGSFARFVANCGRVVLPIRSRRCFHDRCPHCR